MKRQPKPKLTLPVDASWGVTVNLSTETIGARIKAARKAMGLTQDALATLAGATSNRGLQDNEAGKTMPGGQMIRALVIGGINANWLLTGEGPMFLDDMVPQQVKGVVPMAGPAKINVEALAQTLAAVLTTAPPGETQEQSARKTVQFYMQMVERGMLTPDGVGDGDLDAVA